MRIYYDVRETKLYELQKNTFFTPLMTFLQKRPNCTLRELNQEFPQKGFVKYLESCIQVGWVLREERRYTLALPIYTKETVVEVSRQPKLQELFLELAALSDEELAALFQQLKDYQPATPYIVTEDVLLGCIQEAGVSGELQLFSLITKPESTDLAGFFVANRHLEEPAHYRQLVRLIGDVDEEYYFQQVRWILSRIVKGKAPKDSIFRDSLEISGIISDDNRLQIPYLRNLTESSLLLSKITDLTHFELGILLGIVSEKRFEGLFQWFYKEK